MVQVSAACLESLEDLAVTARIAAGDCDAEQHAATLHQALQSYTVKAEREIHEALAAKSKGLVTNVVSIEAPPQAAVVAVGDTEFGDNIELF
jgi:hypothetical protein